MMSVKGEIKLIDFGLCGDLSDGPTTKILGSPYWIPPEMILNKPHSEKVDIWSFGACLLELYLKTTPFDSTIKAMFTVGTKGMAQCIPDFVTEDARDFLKKCLTFNQYERASASELLKHPWVNRPGLKKGIDQILYKIFLSQSLKSLGF